MTATTAEILVAHGSAGGPVTHYVRPIGDGRWEWFKRRPRPGTSAQDNRAIPVAKFHARDEAEATAHVAREAAAHDKRLRIDAETTGAAARDEAAWRYE